MRLIEKWRKRLPPLQQDAIYPYLKTRRHHKVPPPIGYKFAANIAQLKSQPFYLILEIEVHDSRKSIPR